MTRIAVGGFLHETNTFAPTKATYDDFVHGGGWPAMTTGAAVLKTMRDINVGLAGALVMYDRSLSLGRFAGRPALPGGPAAEAPPLTKPVFGPPKLRSKRGSRGT